MTDKQIIIDDQKKTIHRLQDECTEKTNVIIALGEQLKAKEQECEELAYENYELNELFDRLKAENDELKEEKQGLIKDWEEKKNLAYEIACKNEKLKQTLTEIKEIAEFYNNSNMDNICYQDGIYEILQKISEVENGFHS